MIQLGDEPVPRAEPDLPWPGQLPQPSPAVLLDDPVELLDAQGNPIRVTSRGMFSADPARLTGMRSAGTTGCAGGRDRGRSTSGGGTTGLGRSTAGGRTVRAQVLLESERALLLCFRQRRWYLEGIYE